MALFIAGACSDNAQVVDTAAECVTTCTRFQECEDPSYDVQGCESNCTHQLDNNSSFQQQLESCSVCLEGKSCMTAFNDCQACNSIVP